jgi:hypothetical protein
MVEKLHFPSKFNPKFAKNLMTCHKNYIFFLTNSSIGLIKDKIISYYNLPILCTNPILLKSNSTGKLLYLLTDLYFFIIFFDKKCEPIDFLEFSYISFTEAKKIIDFEIDLIDEDILYYLIDDGIIQKFNHKSNEILFYTNFSFVIQSFCLTPKLLEMLTTKRELFISKNITEPRPFKCDLKYVPFSVEIHNNNLYIASQTGDIFSYSIIFSPDSKCQNFEMIDIQNYNFQINKMIKLQRVQDNLYGFVNSPNGLLFIFNESKSRTLIKSDRVLGVAGHDILYCLLAPDQLIKIHNSEFEYIRIDPTDYSNLHNFNEEILKVDHLKDIQSRLNEDEASLLKKKMK